MALAVSETNIQIYIFSIRGHSNSRRHHFELGNLYRFGAALTTIIFVVVVVVVDAVIVYLTGTWSSSQ